MPIDFNKSPLAQRLNSDEPLFPPKKKLKPKSEIQDAVQRASDAIGKGFFEEYTPSRREQITDLLLGAYHKVKTLLFHLSYLIAAVVVVFALYGLVLGYQDNQRCTASIQASNDTMIDKYCD